MASIHVNGIDLYYEVHGSGMPLVMLHGNGEDHTTFSTLCAALQDRFQIYLFDTRGHGKSTPVSEYHYSDMAQDMTEALIQLFDGPIDLLGFSDGGIIALFLAIWYPQLVRRMILCGANYHPYGIKEEGRRDMRAEYARSGDPRMALMLEEPLLTKADLSRVQCPTCVLAGQNDIIEEAHAEAAKISREAYLTAPATNLLDAPQDEAQASDEMKEEAPKAPEQGPSEAKE